MSFEHEQEHIYDANTHQFEYIVDSDAEIVEDDPLADPLVETDDHLSPDTESNVLHWTRPALFSKETLGTLARQLSPLLVPLPFAILIFLFTLPATLQGPPAHPSPVVMAMLLLAMTILQGTLLYFAGSNDTLWLLYIVCGYALFVTLGVGAAFGWMAALLTLATLIVLGFIPVRRGIHPTSEGHVDIVESFGKYAHTLYPGLNLLMPWEKMMRRLNVQETTWTCEEQRVSISRDHFVRLTATISYQLLPEDAHLAALASKDWENSLRLLFVGTLQSEINHLSPAEIVSWPQSLYTSNSSNTNSFDPVAATRWDLINDKLRRRVQDQAASLGVEVNWVRIQEPTLLPHPSGGATLLMENDPPRPGKPTPAVSQAQAPAPRPEPAKAAPQAAAPPPRTPMKKASGIETLVDAYNSVRQGAITDPATILQIAQRFEQLDSDPVASKMIDFDASRAAATLRQRAQRYQERANTSSMNTRRES